MMYFKITTFIFLLSLIVLVKSEPDNTSESNDICNEETIKRALANLESSKLEIYNHIDEPGFNKMMADYGTALHIFKNIIADKIVNVCSNIDQTTLKDYLKRHLNMEACLEGMLNQEEIAIETKCPLVQDQGNINCMVNGVVNGTEGFQRILEYCNNTELNTSHKLMIYNALSQESQAGVENYKNFYDIMKEKLSVATLTDEEKDALRDILRNIIWASFKNNPPTLYPELITDVYTLNDSLGQKIARDLVVQAVNKQIDVLQLQLLIEHIPSITCKIRAYLYVYGHISDYPNPDEAKFGIAYPMYALKHSSQYSEVDSQLRASLDAAYETLPEYAKEFMKTGEVCFDIARFSNDSVDKKQEDVFIKIIAGFRKTTNEYLFVLSDNGTVTRCDRSGLASYFFKTAGPPDELGLVRGSTRTTGDFVLSGPEGVDCDNLWTTRNVYFCSTLQYMLSAFQYRQSDFKNFAQAHIEQHRDKVREKCKKN